MADKTMGVSNQDKHEIVDVQVEKLGLVTAGANGEEFFLLKSDETGSAETQTALAGVEAAVAETIWTRMAKVFKRVMSAEAEIAQTDNTADIASMDAADSVALPGVETTVPEFQHSNTESAPSPAIAKVCAPDSTDDDEKDDEEMEPMSKSHPDQTNEMRTKMSDVEMVAKSDYEVLAKSVELLKDRLAKAEAEAEAARDSRERDARIAKAAELTALPVTAVELGSNLHKLAKFDPALAQYFDALIKTADNMLNGLGVFQEYGTSQMPELSEPVMKAAQSADPRAALLSLNARDAAKYVASRQAATRRGGVN